MPMTRATRPWFETALVIAAAAVGILLFTGVATPVHFEAEHIEVTVSSSHVGVEGVYSYCNHAPWPTSLRLGVPFPVDSTHLWPDALAADEVDAEGMTKRALPLVVHGDDVSLRFFFLPGQTRRLRLRYTQRTLAPDATYILTTTHDWERAIDRAQFVLRLPVSYTLERSNYELSPLPDRGGYAHHGFTREAFWPEHDWLFAWSTTEETP